MSVRNHILYIENNQFNQRLLKKILEPAGYQVSAAFDGIEGIKQAQELKPDLILMDLDLPQLDGLGATAKIKSMSGLENIPIVALTSATSNRDRDRALVAGCDGCIRKPIKAGSFSDQLRTYLDGKREESGHANRTQILRDFNVSLVDKLQANLEELMTANKELRQNQEALQQAYEQSQKWNLELQRLTKLKENIVAITSHELRTPLSIATGYLDLLLEGLLGVLNDEQSQVLQISRQSLGKVGELIGKISDLSRLSEKKFIMNLEELDLNACFEAVLEDVILFMKIRKIALTPALFKDPIAVLADLNLMNQVFTNLIKNAISFSGDGGRIHVSTWIENGKAFFRIQDSGIGLKEEDLERIFDEFYQVTDINHHKTGQFEYMTRGIGVGLSLCKAIVTELGGKIWAESPGLNQGSSFTFYLPLVS